MDSARSRLEMVNLRLCEKIVKTLDGEGPQRVVLTGKSGIGKTWLARKVGEHATKKGLCYLALWLHLNKKFEDELSLYENIAFEIGVYNRDEKEEKNPEALLKYLKEKITAELIRKKRLADKVMRLSDQKKLEEWTEKKTEELAEEEKRGTSFASVPYILLILDDEGKMTSADDVMKDLGLARFLTDYAPLKVVITKRKGYEGTRMSGEETESTDPHATYEPQDTKSEGEIKSHGAEDPQGTEPDENIEPHTTDESQSLLDIHTKYYIQDLFESLIVDPARGFLQFHIGEPLTSLVAQKSICLPAAVIVLAKSLNCIIHQNTFRSLSLKREKDLKEVLSLSPNEPDYSVSGYNPILQLAYKLLETEDTMMNAITDCFWHSLDIFKLCGCVYYRDLITYWILEGYFDPVRSVKKAYKDGHAILVKLINCGILNIQEGDMIVPEMAMNNLIDLRRHGLLGRSRLRFAKVYGGDKNKGPGKITQIDDMIKTVQSKKQESNCTILVSGNRLRRETPKEFFEKQQMKDLEVLGLFDPTLKFLIQSIKQLKQLRVLVIRDYDLLPSIEELKGLQRLEILEVSGASSLEAISDDFFEAMSELQSLNLSGLQIKSSPSSISQLKNLCSLILRDCPVLEDIPDIQYLDRLEVFDVRGAHKLRNCFGMERYTNRNRTFSRLQQLQHLDFSESRLKRLPIFHEPAVVANLHSLTRLSLRMCSDLVKLPSLRPLSGLQILDVSGATSLVEIAAVCFEQKDELKILNLSGTKLTTLPSTISGLSNLSQLLLRDNFNLGALPNIKGLTSLEVFDVYGCIELHKIEGSFKDMSYLREVNLFGTRIETLGVEFPEKSSICCNKVILLADGRHCTFETWSQLKEFITTQKIERLSSSGTVDELEDSGRVELSVFDRPDKRGHRKEHSHQGHIYRDVYMNTIPFVDTKSYQEVLEIQGSNGVDQHKETLAKAEFVTLVDYSAENLSSIFNDLKSVTGCWLEMCRDIKILFSGVDEERLRDLETMSITNLPLLGNISSSSFKNLKKLNLDCCPSIKMLFPASAPAISLEVLKIKFCEKLERVFEEEVEVPNLHTLCLLELPVLSTIGATLPNLETYKKEKCPKLNT